MDQFRCTEKASKTVQVLDSKISILSGRLRSALTLRHWRLEASVAELRKNPRRQNCTAPAPLKQTGEQGVQDPRAFLHRSHTFSAEVSGKSPGFRSTRDFELVWKTELFTLLRILQPRRLGRPSERASRAQKVPPQVVRTAKEHTATDAGARWLAGQAPRVCGRRSLVYRVDHKPRSDHHLLASLINPHGTAGGIWTPSREELLGPSTAEYNGYIYVQIALYKSAIRGH